MSLVDRWSWLAAPLIVLVMLTVGVGLTGCSSDTGEPASSDDDASPEADDDDTEPTGSGTKPTDPGTEPTDPGTEPTDPATEPTDPGTEPTDPGTDVGVATPIDPSKVSSFAPAADLVAQVDEHIERIEETLASEEDFGDSTEEIGMDGNTLIVVALALGLHDEDSKYKASAGALVKAAQSLTAASDYASAKDALAAIKAAAASTEPAAGELKWEKVASLPALMKKVPSVNTPLKSSLRDARRFNSKAGSLAERTAALAVIAHASIANADETDQPDQVEQWQAFCAEMRDAAAAYNGAAHAKDFPAAKVANERLQASCKACHAVFHPEAEEQ